MKLTSILFASSLVLNAALLGLVAVTANNAGVFKGSGSFFSGSGATADTTHANAKGDDASVFGRDSHGVVSASGKTIGEALKRQDASALRDQLRALGLPEETIRSVVRAMLSQRYYDRYSQLAKQHEGEKSELLRGGSYARGFTKEERAELRKITQDINAQVLSLFGTNLVSPELDGLRFSYLPSEKAESLRQLNRDYSEMRNDLNAESEAFRMPADNEKLKLLEAEKRKDLEALLTPAELTEYDMRNSSVASTLRNRLAKLNISDDEFRRLYAVMKDANDVAPMPNALDFGLDPNKRPTTEQISNLRRTLTPEQIAQVQKYTAAKDASQDEIKAILGDERYAEYQRANVSDYRQLQAAATRFALPQATVDQVYSLRDTVATQSQQIGANTALTPAQKQTALTALAQQTRAQVKSSLGAEIGEAYLSNNMQWLDRVEKGSAVTFNPNGSVRYTHVTRPVKPATEVKTTTATKVSTAPVSK